MPKTMKAYILSDYNEHGAENVVATLDKTKVMELMKSNFQWVNQEDIDKLEYYLEIDKPSKDANNLAVGWGGIQLHIIELQ